MRNQIEHEKLIQKFYPKGAVLSDNMPMPEFSDFSDSDEIKKKRQDDFFDKIDKYCDIKNKNN